MKTLDQLLDHFATLGCTFKCTYDDEVDYVGTNKAEAKEALGACDEMALTILDPSGKPLGWCLIVNDDDIIALADYTIGNPVAEFLDG
jgi:hypothetical protein